jgi:hypothetical protein
MQKGHLYSALRELINKMNSKKELFLFNQQQEKIGIVEYMHKQNVSSPRKHRQLVSYPVQLTHQTLRN